MQRASRLGGSGPKPVPPDALRKLSPWLFAVVVVCFFLPFVTCNGVTATGMQAATGLSPPGSDRAAVEAFRGQTAVPNPFALLALLFALSGLVLAAIWGLKGLVISAVAAVAGTLSLGGFVVYVLGQTHLDVTIEMGLNLTFLAFLVAAAMNDYLLARVPHLVTGDAVGLRSQRARARGWFAALGAATPLTLFLVGWVGETRAPYAAVGLPLLLILAVTAFIFALRGYRDARAALSEDLSGHG